MEGRRWGQGEVERDTSFDTKGEQVSLVRGD